MPFLGLYIFLPYSQTPTAYVLPLCEKPSFTLIQNNREKGKIPGFMCCNLES